jgi:predicted nucleic acid-binding Zn ribbon protein
MSRPRKSNDKRITLTSDESARVARLLEQNENTVIIPAGVLASLVEETKQGAPRFEVVEIDPERALVLDDDVFEQRWDEACPRLAS